MKAFNTGVLYSNMTLEHIFSPRSIAVIGASRQRGTIGREILENLVNFGFTGVVYPVNPRAEVVFSMKCYQSVDEIEDDVDLAIVAVPARIVPEVLETCGHKGVKGAIIISAGFKEIGPKGAELEERIREIAQRYDIRVVGPNCMGVLNTDPNVRMNATFAPTLLPEGRVALISQSGAFGLIIFEYADSIGLGMSKFVSLGNRMDISSVDVLEVLEDDPQTDLILLYLESFGDPRRFTEVTRRISRKKPIIAVKAGRTHAGARAASSHTGAMAASDVAVDSLFEQCGILRADSIRSLFDYAMAFAYQPLPRGPEVAVITNGGGPGIIAADAVVSVGLKMAEFEQSTVDALRNALAAEASVKNPVDMIASAGPDEYRISVRTVLADPNVDAAIVIFVPPIATDPLEIAKAISESSADFEKPVLGCFMGSENVARGVEELERNRIPAYKFPESAAKSLAAMYRYYQYREKEVQSTITFDVDRPTVRSIIEYSRDGYLSLEDAVKVLNSYGLRFPEYGIARSPDEAVRLASRISYPVVLKAIADGLVHKTDVGAVKLDLRTEYEVKGAYYEIVEALKRMGIDDEKFHGIAVQRMLHGGKETIIGVTTDPVFGPLIMFGMGGIYVEVLKDVVFRIPPVSNVDAREMIEAIRGHPILSGVRGEGPSDVDALIEAIQRVSQLVIENPEIQEMDLNPVMVMPEGQGIAVLDVRIKISHGTTSETT